MNFLKSILTSSGGFPGYTIQDKIDVPPNSLFTLHNAISRESNTPCSIHIFDTSKESSLLPLARNVLSKLRTLKHPGVVKFFDSYEGDGQLCIATERVAPLHHTLLKHPDRDTLLWGLYSVAQTIAFLNTEATSVHGAIQVSSIYTTESGEWKVAGFDVLSCMKDEDPAILRLGPLVPGISTITPQELQSKGFGHLRNINYSSLDSWQFACLIWVCFNGTLPSASSLQIQDKIPNAVFAQYRRLLSPSAQSRLPVTNFLDFGRRPNGFFRSDLIEISEEIMSLSLKSKSELEAFLQKSIKMFSSLPSGYSTNKLLPELIKSFEFGDGAGPAFGAILTIAKGLAPADVEILINPVIMRIWTSKDRAKQLVLLENLKDYIQHLSQKQINDKLFPSIGVTFTDPAPIMRETAIRQIMILTPFLTDRHINGDLLKYLAKTANDQQPGIRTNTTICLGKIAPHLGVNNKRKVLTAAFSRSLKDPFVHARMASLQAIGATVEAYDKEDLANRLMPGMTPLLIDGEKSIRDQARKILNMLLERLVVLTQAMPESLQAESTNSDKTNAKNKANNGTIETAGVWAGWAISSLSRNIDSSSPAPTSNSTSEQSLGYSRSATNTPDIHSSNPTTTSSFRASKDKAPAVPSGNGLKLHSKPRKVDLSSIYAEDFGTGGDAWGTDDWEEEESSYKAPAAAPPRKTKVGLIKSTTADSIPLAAPLAKSHAKVTSPAAPDTAEVEEDTTDWDTDAW